MKLCKDCQHSAVMSTNGYVSVERFYDAVRGDEDIIVGNIYDNPELSGKEV